MAPAPPIRPSFTELFEQYLETYNTHDIYATLSYLSEGCVSYYRNQPILMSPLDFETAYRQHWDKSTDPVMILDIEEFSHGVYVVMQEIGKKRRRSACRYWYGLEADGVWRQVRHEVLEA
ncbi:hypothetical protein BJ508DRAFT_323970 [Ascobolus immersus RN42]|uniref:SnoaL-like domain-containing protein n=1 Tax=Ascobolus immersus RN42 TaxID=1160509 RepID=A0A3N4IEG5_ASCIM|nr:hypothetical protein BJ508DRAFT_323970 [Ascobolus immersus RN42]